MQINDFVLCTFEGDTSGLPINRAAEINGIDAGAGNFTCRLPDTGQEFTIQYNNEPWTGTDSAGQSYTLASHSTYTGGSVDPFAEGAAIITFADGRRFLAHINSVDPAIELSLYNGTLNTIRVENNTVTQSDWSMYPEGTQVTNMEGCKLASDVTVAVTPPAGGNGQHQQFLFVDVYAGDLKGKPNWEALVNTPKFYGAIVKATEGLHYSGGEWFKKNWPAVKEVGKERYGKTWFRGAYHFLKFNQDGSMQADYYLKSIEDAGGWDDGDIIPIIDVELGNDGGEDLSKRNSNQDATAQQIIDCTTACADRLRSVTGRKIMLYGRGAMRDRDIKSKMGCDIVWNPAYTKTMVINGLQAWQLSDIALWQYCGDGTAAIDPDKLPHSISNFGEVDISVYIDGANKPTYESLIERMGIGTVN